MKALCLDKWADEKIEILDYWSAKKNVVHGSECDLFSSPFANTIEMSLRKCPNTQIALVELPSGLTLEDCGCTGQLADMNVCICVHVKQGVDEREYVCLANIPRIN